MDNPREFEGMCNQDIEQFCSEQGIPIDLPEEDEIEDDSDYWLRNL